MRCMLLKQPIVTYEDISADPASPWPRQGGAWDHRRCGTLLSLKATVNCTTASDLLWASKLTDASLRPQFPTPVPLWAFPTPKSSLALAWFRLAPCLVLWDFGVVLWDFKTDRWPPVPISLELALAMLRLAPWLVLWGFKTDGWPPVPPISKASPSPKCRWSWLQPCCGWRLGWFYGISKLTDGPLSRSQRLPQAQNVVGAGFSHAAAGPLSGFIGFQNWRMAPCPDLKGFPKPKMSLELALAMLRLAGFMGFQNWRAAGPLSGCMGFQNWRVAPCPDPKGFPKPKMSLELALAMLRLTPSLVLWDFKTDGWPPSRSQRLPEAQNVVGAGFSDEKLMRGWPPLWFYGISKLTDGPRSRSQRLPHA